MQYVLLIAVVAAAFVFGWFLMGKLDRFLEANCHRQELQHSSGENTLQIGFCNPTAADSIFAVLEQYSKLYPDISIRLFCGSEEELLKGISAGRFNMIFLPENAEIPAHMHYNFKVVSLNHTPVLMKYGGLPIEPITDGPIIQITLWVDGAASAFINYFIKCLEDKFPASAQSK